MAGSGYEWMVKSNAEGESEKNGSGYPSTCCHSLQFPLAHGIPVAGYYALSRPGVDSEGKGNVECGVEETRVLYNRRS